VHEESPDLVQALVRAGDIFAGKYRVERVIGRGGMGIVVAAMHLELDERVAIKLLPPNAQSAETIARFVREGRAAAQIRSQHVARVRDVGRLDSGVPYIVMEYLEGEDLAETLERRGRLPVTESVELVLQTCEALAEAHTKGIVHRDLKPANLFVTRHADGSPCLKVLDFGISKLLRPTEGEDARALTQTSMTMGTPLYMSPEQLRSARTVDARADLWALGVIFFELLAGQRPFVADDLPQLSVKIVIDPPTPLRAVAPELPAALERIILRCLEKDPAARWPSVADLARSLAEFAPPRALASIDRIASLGAHAAPPSGGAPSCQARHPARTPPRWSTSTPSSLGLEDTELDGSTARRSRRRYGALGIGAAAIAVGALSLTMITRRTPTSEIAAIRTDATPGSTALIASPIDASVAPPPDAAPPVPAPTASASASATAPATAPRSPAKRAKPSAPGKSAPTAPAPPAPAPAPSPLPFTTPDG
jgi:serine/threonine-protein kinase